jgi:Fic family protein
VARLLTSQLLLREGYGVTRYVSIEQRIYDAKNRYYDSLRESSQGWHDGNHSIWPWASFLVSTLAAAYDVFEERVAASRGTGEMNKRRRVEEYVTRRAPITFTLGDIRGALPGVSTQTIHKVLKELKQAGSVETLSRGRNASYRRL